MNFIESFDLFAGTYIAGILVAGTLSLVGVWLIARDQIFAGAGFSQASVLGAAAGILISETFHHMDDTIRDSIIYSFTIGASAFAAVLVEFFSDRRSRPISSESVISLIYLFSAAFAVLVVSRAPHGLQEITTMLSSSVLGLGMNDVILFACVFLITIVLAKFFFKKLLVVSVDSGFAASTGISVKKVRFFTALYIGIVAGLSIRYSGMLFTFGFLVLPGLSLRSVVKSPIHLLILSPVMGIIGALTGFWVAHTLDLPLAQTAVALITLPVIAAFIYTGKSR